MRETRESMILRILVSWIFMCASIAAQPVVIAHRGASGYLPEHTLEAKAMAHAMRADYLEQDVVLTRDNQAVVLHDVYLDAVTNVRDLFPDRHRPDGRYYAIDFELAEIKQLRVHERMDLKKGQAAFPRRFPADKLLFRVPTLAEEIELIQGLNQSTGRKVGIYPEIKSPAWHREQGKDPSRVVLELLRQYGYRDKQSPAFLQCFDVAETQRIRNELGCELMLVQLIEGDSWNEEQRTLDSKRYPGGLEAIATYADGIGPALTDVIRGGPTLPTVTSLTAMAQASGLQVHPYTLRRDTLPPYAESFDELLERCFDQARVNGVFTDFPDDAVRVRDRRKRK